MNGVKHDNRLYKLEVVTASENSTHKFRVLGHAAPNNPSFGVKNGSAKLDPDKVRMIRYLCAEKVPQRLIAETFDVTRELVSLINRRKLWAHVD